MATGRYCDLCLCEDRVYTVTSAKDISVALKNFFPQIICKIKCICRKCWRKTESFNKFHGSILSNFEGVSMGSRSTVKRSAFDLSPGLTPKRFKFTNVKHIHKEQIGHKEKAFKNGSETPTVQGFSHDHLYSEKSLYIDPGSRRVAVRKMLNFDSQLNSGAKKTQTSSHRQSLGHDHKYSEFLKSSSADTKWSGGNNMMEQVCSSVDAKIKETLLNEIDVGFKSVNSNKKSVLFQKKINSLMEENLFQSALHELKSRVPVMYEILQRIVGNTGNKEATIAMIYSMILNSQNRKASAIQQLITILAMKCHADNQLLRRLNKLNITMSAESKSIITSKMGQHCERRVVKVIEGGANGKLNGDNVDIYVHTNDIRMENHNKDYHFFATDWTPFRIESNDYECNEWLKHSIQPENALPQTEVTLAQFSPDIQKFKHNIKYLVARQLIEHLPTFKWMELLVPEHIPHTLQEIMSRPTKSYCLPILLRNEAKYEDCIKIMDAYEKQVKGWYEKAGREDDFANLQIPVGGDQLTRVRLDGAKSLRIGAHTMEERFDNLQPIIVEMFHTQMDFLEKTIKKFMVQASGRDQGTLTHMKTLIQRTSANGNVKSRFKAHLDFMMLCGTAYILEAALEYFEMDGLTDQPSMHTVPSNIGRTHNITRSRTFNEVMDGFMNTLYGPLSLDETSVEGTIKLDVDGNPLNLQIHDGNVSLQLEKEGSGAMIVHLPVAHLQENTTYKIVVGNVGINVKKLKADDLQNYILNFLQYFFIMLNLKDAYKEGDIFRVSNTLKMMIPLFYKHSSQSKYFDEIVDFILKTEIMLPPKLGIQVRVASFVNPKGKRGKNKPSDLQKENQVKHLKDLIRGLGSNKTEQSIIAISKAAPVLSDIVDNLDLQIGYHQIKTSHKKGSERNDLHEMLELLRELKPFIYTSGRQLHTYRNIKQSVFLELQGHVQDFNMKLLNTAMRLKRSIPDLRQNIDNTV